MLYGKLSSQQKSLVGAAVGGAEKIDTWDEFLNRKAGFGEETNRSLLSLFAPAKREGISLENDSFVFYSGVLHSSINADNARILKIRKDLYFIYPSLRDVQEESKLSEILYAFFREIDQTRRGVKYKEIGSKESEYSSKHY